MSDAEHWDRVYARGPDSEVSWFQEQPGTSLRLVLRAIEAVGDGPVSVVDVGGGTSRLADALLAEDAVPDVTVVDVSAEALALVRERLSQVAARVSLVQADIRGWLPGRTFTVWHDRAVFHFLTDPQARASYVDLAARSVAPGGALVLGVFAADGPTSCSGLPTVGYRPDAIEAVFAHAFTLEHAEREEHRTPSGAVQPFSWTVLRRRGGSVAATPTGRPTAP